MPEDVENAFMQIASQMSEGENDGMDIIKAMQASLRYQTETWSWACNKQQATTIWHSVPHILYKKIVLRIDNREIKTERCNS